MNKYYIIVHHILVRMALKIAYSLHNKHMKRFLIFAIKKSRQPRKFVAKVASLQSLIEYQTAFNNTLQGESELSHRVMLHRILGISKTIQVCKVVGYDLIRVGGPNDGGYVMLKNLDEVDGVLSLGVGPDVSWDTDVSEKIPLIHLYDHTIEKLPKPIPTARWFKEKVVAKGDSTGTSFEEAVARLPDTNQLLLKCDIEDSEWEIFSNCDSKILEKFDQIVVEFHWLADKICNDKYDLALNALQNLARTHSVVNIHANNYAKFQIIANCPIPDVIEISYVRTKSYKFEQNPLVKNLNAPNFLEKPEIYLNFPIPL